MALPIEILDSLKVPLHSKNTISESNCTSHQNECTKLTMVLPIAQRTIA